MVENLPAIFAFIACGLALVVGVLWMRARASRDVLHSRVASLERERAMFAGFVLHLPYPAFVQDERGDVVFTNEAARADDTWRERDRDQCAARLARGRKRFSIRFPIVVDGRPWLAGLEIDGSRGDTMERRLGDATLETLFEWVPAPLWIVRSAGGAIDGNAAAHELFGSSVVRGSGEPSAWPFMRDARLLERDETPLAIALHEGRSVLPTDLEVVRTDGTRRHVRLTAAPLLDLGGQLRGAVAVALDLSQLRHYETELEHAVRRRDEFLAVLAHELRNPLAPVRNSVQILQRVPGDVERVKRATATIDRQTLLLVRLIDDLLDVARVSQGLVELDLAPHTLGEIVDAAVDSMRGAAETSGHELIIEHSAPGAIVNVDALRAQQIVTNLLSNALKYSLPRSSVTVRTCLDGANASIVVIDRGQGIPVEFQSEIFTMFARAGPEARGRTRGMGVGLALAKQLSEQQGGAIRVSSEGRGRGSTFTVSFPVATPAATAAA